MNSSSVGGGTSVLCRQLLALFSLPRRPPAGGCDQPIDLRTVRPLLRRSKPSASAHQWEL